MKFKDLVKQILEDEGVEGEGDGADAEGTSEASTDTTKKKKHPGFKKVASDIAKKQGIDAKQAAAILASKTRNASEAAKKANPNLNKVK
jgi:hypothetical protein